MADYAPNYTARYKLQYSTYGDVHDLGLRFPASMSQNDVKLAAEAFLDEIFTNLAPKMTVSWTVLGAEYSAANSNFFFPIGYDGPAPAGVVNAGVAPIDEIVMSTWSGRTVGGHGTRFVLFGLFWNAVTDPVFDDFTVTPTEYAPLSGVRASLNTAGMVGNDNVAATFWNPNVSAKVSDAWRTRRKAGG